MTTVQDEVSGGRRNPAEPRVKQWLYSNVTLRFAVVGLLVIVMLIPLGFVSGIASERQGFFYQTVRDIAAGWGRDQAVVGPVMVIPAFRNVRDDRVHNGVVVETRTRRVPLHLVVLPDQLTLDVDLAHQMRRRAIYDVPVFHADVQMTGTFPKIELAKLEDPPDGVLFDQARLVIGLGDTRAISRIGPFELGETSLAVEPGAHYEFVASQGVHVPLPDYDGEASEPFSLALELKGTDAFQFAPVGAATEVAMRSSWPHPSFAGAYLPDRYEVSAEGFDAQWSVHAFARGLPGLWVAEQREFDIDQHAGGVRLHNPVTAYTLVDRGIKYGILFVALTYLVFVCFEMLARTQFHLVQYGVVGVGLALFYLTLLSLSEHIGFGLAYGLATVIMTAMISWYVRAITGRPRLGGVIAVVELALYGVLYVLLQLEAYALMTGTAVLLCAFALIMYVTRNLNAGGETAEDPLT